MRSDDLPSRSRADAHEVRTSCSHELSTFSSKPSRSKASSSSSRRRSSTRIRRSRSDFDYTTTHTPQGEYRGRESVRNSANDARTRQDDGRESQSESGEYHDKQMTAETLPWLHEDHRRLLKQAYIFREHLVEHREFIPTLPMQHLLASMDSILSKKTVSRNDASLREISMLLKKMKVVHLSSLIHLLEGQQQLKEKQGNVIVLCGASGAGKTTTLLHLADTKFEEVEMDGFFHLKPKKFSDRGVLRYQTSCGSSPMTRTMQVAHISAASARIMVCDTPGHGVTSTVEQELATGLGFAFAMKNATRVKPVVVVNSEDMGTWCSNLEEVFHVMREQFYISTKEDLKAVEYVFTNYEERHRTRLRQQLATLQKNAPSGADEEPSLWQHFMNDITEKTTPEANIALPMTEPPQRLLRAIWRKPFIQNPSFYFQSFASNDAMQRLQVQLQITLQTLITALAQEEYSLAVDEMVLLNKMTIWLPDICQHAEFAKEAGVRQVQLIWDLVLKAMSKENFHTVFYRLNQLKVLGSVFPTASVHCQSAHDRLWRYLMSPLRNKDFDKTLERIEIFLKVGGMFPDAMGYARRVVGMLAESVELCVERGEYNSTLAVITYLSRLKEVFSEARDCASVILSALRNKLESSIMATDFKTATELLLKLSSVSHLYPEAGDYTRLGPDLFLGTIDSLVARKEYVNAITLISHLNKPEHGIPEAETILHDGLHLIEKSVEESVRGGDYSRAVSLIQKMRNIEEQIPEASDIILHIRRLLGTNIENAFAKNNYLEAFQAIETLRRVMPDVGEFTSGGLQRLRSTIRVTLAQKEYKKLFDLFRQLNTLVGTSPEAKAGIDDGFNMLEDHVLLAVEKQDFQSAISVLGYLSTYFPQASQTAKCTRMGIQAMIKNVAKSIERNNFSSAIELIHELRDSSDILTEVTECARQGLEMLAKSNETALAKGDYETSIKIMNSASELANSFPESFEFTKAGLTMVVQHLTGLRNSVKIEIGHACESQDLKKFAEIMFALKSDMDKVLKSEPLRKLSVQIHYKKEFRASATNLANEIVVPQLYTGQSFCSDNLQKLAASVKAEMPNPDMDQANIEALIRNRKAILSSVMRLKIANKVLHDFPGGENVTAVYKQAYQQYYQVVESVLIASESSFKPPVDSRVFELQAWFLEVLIHTFIKDAMDIGSEERKKMETFEERRKGLMLQFEARVSDAMELLSGYEFPDLRGEPNYSDASPIQNLNLSLLEPPRKILVSLGQTPQLCKMVAEHLDVSGIKDIVKTFDNVLIDFIRQVVFLAEGVYDNMIIAVKTGDNLASVLEKAIALRSYNAKIKIELLSVRAWSHEIAIETEPFLTRLFVNQQRIDDAIVKVKQEIEEENIFGLREFFARLAEDSGACMCQSNLTQLADL